MKLKNSFRTMKEFLAIIPVYNEEESIYEIIQKIKHVKKDIDILVVNDGSTDNTGEKIKQIPGISVITHTENKGYGRALAEGFKYAIDHDYTYAITIDCDKQHDPSDISKFLEQKDKNYDIISGSRYKDIPPEQKKKIPKDRLRINTRITQKLNTICNFELTDAFCGLKMYRVEALKSLRLTEDGYAMPLQLLMQARQNNLTLKEIPVKCIYFDNTDNAENTSGAFKRYMNYLRIIQNENKAL